MSWQPLEQQVATDNLLSRNPKKWPICLQGKYQTEKGNYWRSLDHRRIIERKQKCGGWYVICGGKWMERLEEADQCLYCWHLGWVRVAPARWSLLDHPHNSLMPARLISSTIIICVRRSYNTSSSTVRRIRAECWVIAYMNVGVSLNQWISLLVS